jgi:acyl-coenzyme A thioesterase PaaI-like protein
LGRVAGLSAESFVLSDLSTAEVESSERVHGALADDLRRLVDVAIRTLAEPDRVARVRDLVREAEELLAEDASPDPAGLKFNAEGRSWNWGNTVVGVRNAMAPPVLLEWGDDGSVRSEVTLGAVYEGPPGCVHGGVSALLLDHLMGETASAAHTRLTVTGTLTLRYVRPLPLGRVHMEARIAEEDGRKVSVVGHIGPDEPGNEPAIEAHGLFIIPRWASDEALPSDVGSLD